MIDVDVIVIGSGAAGLVAAQEAAATGLSVVVLNKGQVGRSGATTTITGDISVDSRTATRLLGLAGNEADSEEAFYEETIRGGAYLNHPKLVEAMVTGVGAEMRSLIDSGLKSAGLIRSPGHSFPRGFLFSGMQLVQLLVRRAKAAGVRFRDEFYVTDLVTGEAGITGVVGVDLRVGKVAAIQARSVILACGGGGMVHPLRTVPEELVGDGYHMALRAGAELIDMEMLQFLPCCLVNPSIWRGIQFPWIIGPQSGMRAWLLNRFGERFMERYDPERMEMSTRDIISIASVREIQEGRGGPGGGVFMSWAHLPRDVIDFLPQWYGKPLLQPNWIWEGFDFAPLVERIRQGHAVEVAPACHFLMGGVRIDESYETTVQGLFACGEVAGGVHGANRLSGNACTQFLVQGRLAGRSAASHARRSTGVSMDAATVREKAAEIEAPFRVRDGVVPHELMAKIQAVAVRALNVLRTGSDLEAAMAEMSELRSQDVPNLFSRSADRPYNRDWITALEARSAALSVEAMLVSASARKESRGAHYRHDHPDLADEPVNGIVSLSGEALVHGTRPVPAA